KPAPRQPEEPNSNPPVIRPYVKLKRLYEHSQHIVKIRATDRTLPWLGCDLHVSYAVMASRAEPRRSRLRFPFPERGTGRPTWLFATADAPTAIRVQVPQSRSGHVSGHSGPRPSWLNAAESSNSNS